MITEITDEETHIKTTEEMHQEEKEMITKFDEYLDKVDEYYSYDDSNQERKIIRFMSKYFDEELEYRNLMVKICNKTRDIINAMDSFFDKMDEIEEIQEVETE